MNATITDSTWQEMERLRGLGEDTGKDPLQLAVEELQTYKRAEYIMTRQALREG